MGFSGDHELVFGKWEILNLFDENNMFRDFFG